MLKRTTHPQINKMINLFENEINPFRKIHRIIDLFETIIKSHTAFIIADYFIDKSLIFARKTLQNDEYALYSRLFGIINSALPKPDLIIYLYNNVRQLKQNILSRGRDYEKEIEFSYLEKIQSGYLEYFKTMKGFRIIIVETVNLDFVGIESDYAKLKNILNSDYNEGIHTITF